MNMHLVAQLVGTVSHLVEVACVIDIEVVRQLW
jgi:hypothetical protein